MRTARPGDDALGNDTGAEIRDTGGVWWTRLLVFGVEDDGFAFKLRSSLVSDGEGAMVGDGQGGDVFGWVGRNVARE